MDDVDGRVEAMCGAPAGCAFLSHVEAAGLTAEVAADPAVAVYVAAVAWSEVQSWSGDHDEMVARALAEGARLAGLARAILTQPAAAWWFEPIDCGSQLWIPQTKERPDPAAIVTPIGEPDSWERYAQKPRGGLYTSTGVDGTSSALATLAGGTSDYAVDVSLPVTLYRLQVVADARVFEVDGSRAWRSFCLSYPATGEDGRVVPNWGAAARDWDAVHISLGGILTAEQVRIEGVGGWTEHNGWDFEQTVWLRWVFTEATALGELTGYPDYPVALRQPRAFLLDGEKPWRRVISLAADSE